MTGLYALWLPILLTSVIVFVASSIIHMVLPWHKSDYPETLNEKRVLDALRPPPYRLVALPFRLVEVVVAALLALVKTLRFLPGRLRA